MPYALPSGVEFRVDGLEAIPGHMRVDLCRGNIGVAEEFLHDTQIRAAF